MNSLKKLRYVLWLSVLLLTVGFIGTKAFSSLTPSSLAEAQETRVFDYSLNKGSDTAGQGHSVATGTTSNTQGNAIPPGPSILPDKQEAPLVAPSSQDHMVHVQPPRNEQPTASEKPKKAVKQEVSQQYKEEPKRAEHEPAVKKQEESDSSKRELSGVREDVAYGQDSRDDRLVNRPDDPSRISSKATLQVTDVFERVKIPVTPKRILTLGPNATQIALSVGTVPGTFYVPEDAAEATDAALDAVGFGKGTEFYPERISLKDLEEKIREIKPDLIISDYSKCDNYNIVTSEAVADIPVVSLAYYPSCRPGTPQFNQWEESAKLVGEALGKASRMNKQISEVYDTVEELMFDHVRLEGSQYMRVDIDRQNQLAIVDGPVENQFTDLMKLLGMKQALQISATASPRTPSRFVMPLEVAKYMYANHVFIYDLNDPEKPKEDAYGRDSSFGDHHTDEIVVNDLMKEIDQIHNITTIVKELKMLEGRIR